MSSVWKEILPRPIWKLLRGSRRKLLTVALKDTLGHLDGKEIISVFNSYGLNVSQIADYYSPLPRRPRSACVYEFEALLLPSLRLAAQGEKVRSSQIPVLALAAGPTATEERKGHRGEEGEKI
jgi:hypothetical protein